MVDDAVPVREDPVAVWEQSFAAQLREKEEAEQRMVAERKVLVVSASGAR